MYKQLVPRVMSVGITVNASPSCLVMRFNVRHSGKFKVILNIAPTHNYSMVNRSLPYSFVLENAGIE